MAYQDITRHRVSREAKEFAWTVAVSLIATVFVIRGARHVWELAMLGVLVSGIVAWCRLGGAHPLACIPTFYAAYFLIGVQNWVQPTTRIGFRGYVPIEPTLRLATLGIVSYMVGVLTVGGWRRAPHHGAGYRPRIDPGTVGKLLAGFGFIGLLLTVAKHGIPLLHPAARAGANHGIAPLLAQAFIPAALLLALKRGPRLRRELVTVGFFCGLLLLFAYRTPIVLTAGGYVFMKLVRGELRERALIWTVAGLSVFAVALFNYRTESLGRTLPYYAASGPLANHPGLFSLYIGFPREGVAVLARLADFIPATQPHFNGAVQLGTFGALLPGKQTSPREYITNIAYGTQVAATSLTPTLVGGPYVDFGYPGVVLELLALGLLTGAFYRRLFTRRTNVWGPAAYAYWLALLATAVHSGLLDASAVLLVPALVAVCLGIAALLMPAR